MAATLTPGMIRRRPDATPPRAALEGSEPGARLGVALGGGGARGLAHIGVLQVLGEAGLGIGALAGASMGAIVAGLFAADPDLLDDPTRLADLLSDAPGNPWRSGSWRQRATGLLEAFGYLEHDLFGLGRDSGDRLEKDLDAIVAHRTIEELDIPFAASATDVITGEVAVLRSGNLARALHASAALPGVFTPVAWGSRWLIDGGVVSNLPVRATRALGADVVVGVSVTPPLAPVMPRTGVGLLLRLNALTAHRLQAEEFGEADVQLVVPVPSEIGLFAFDRLERLIAFGRAAALRALPEIERAVEARSGQVARPAPRPSARDVEAVRVMTPPERERGDRRQPGR